MARGARQRGSLQNTMSRNARCRFGLKLRSLGGPPGSRLYLQERTSSDRSRWSVSCHERKSAHLFDHLVCADQQRRRHGKTKRSCGPQIDDELELRRPLNRNVHNLVTSQDPISDLNGSREIVFLVGSVTHQESAFRSYTKKRHSWQAIAFCRRGKFLCDGGDAGKRKLNDAGLLWSRAARQARREVIGDIEFQNGRFNIKSLCDAKCHVQLASSGRGLPGKCNTI